MYVSDSSSGIDPEHLPFVFDRFYRADKTRETSSGHTGLGLSICKALVTDISIQDRPVDMISILCHCADVAADFNLEAKLLSKFATLPLSVPVNHLDLVCDNSQSRMASIS